MINISYNLRTFNIEIRFHKDPTILLLVKRIPGKVYHADRYWFVPLEQGHDLKPYIDRFIEEARAAGHETEVEDMVWTAIEVNAEWKERNYKLSTANEYIQDEHIASCLGRDLNKPPWNDLTQIQKARIRYLFENARGCIYGGGDRVVPLAAIEYGLWFPALIVCADNKKFLFGSEFKRMTRRQVFVVESEALLIHEAREAATGKPQFAELCVINFGNLAKYREWLATIDFQVMVIDQGECIRSSNSEQAKILLDLGRVISKKFILSSTMFHVKPWELCTQLEIIERMCEFGGREKFLQDYAVTVHGVWQPRNVERLETELRSICYTR